MRRRNESGAISPKKGREETHTNIKKEEEKHCGVRVWRVSGITAIERLKN